MAGKWLSWNLNLQRLMAKPVFSLLLLPRIIASRRPHQGSSRLCQAQFPDVGGFSSIWSVTQNVTSKQMFLIREWWGGQGGKLQIYLSTKPTWQCGKQILYSTEYESESSWKNGKFILQGRSSHCENWKVRVSQRVSPGTLMPGV